MLTYKSNHLNFFAKAAVDYNLVSLDENLRIWLSIRKPSLGEISEFGNAEYAILYDMIQKGMCKLTNKATMPVLYKSSHGDFISEQLFLLLSLDNKIVDASKGGLVLGNSHKNGGIPMIQETDNGYKIIGSMESHEYIFSYDTIDKFRKEIIQINNSTVIKDDIEVNYEPDNNITLIECYDKILLLQPDASQYIVNKIATKEHLSQLENFKQNTY